MATVRSFLSIAQGLSVTEEPDKPDVLKSFERALWLLTARRQHDDSQPIENQWLGDEIRKLRGDEDPAQYLASIGELIGALVEVSSFFLTGWAHSSGEDAEAIIAVTRRIGEETYGE
jgi:hypothetical protein